MSIASRAMEAGGQPLRSRIVTDDEMGRALDWLRDNASEIGAARARLIKAERMLAHIEALCTKASDASSDQKRKADARTDPRWLEAVQEEAEAAGAFETMRALREAAVARLEAWRSEQATIRGIRI